MQERVWLQFRYAYDKEHWHKPVFCIAGDKWNLTVWFNTYQFDELVRQLSILFDDIQSLDLERIPVPTDVFTKDSNSAVPEYVYYYGWSQRDICITVYDETIPRFLAKFLPL